MNGTCLIVMRKERAKQALCVWIPCPYSPLGSVLLVLLGGVPGGGGAQGPGLGALQGHNETDTLLLGHAGHHAVAGALGGRDGSCGQENQEGGRRARREVTTLHLVAQALAYGIRDNHYIKEKAKKVTLRESSGEKWQVETADGHLQVFGR